MQLNSTPRTVLRTTACAVSLLLLGASNMAMAAANTGISHTNTMTPAGQIAIKQGVTIQAATLTSIKQVEYTDQGTETWIQVQGTGHCKYTIEGAGLAPQMFESSAAKPFPMKVKIQGAPLGSHLWTAKGTGSCTGTATTTFSVNG